MNNRDRETRLRRRIDELLDQRDEARARAELEHELLLQARDRARHYQHIASEQRRRAERWKTTAARRGL